METPDVTTKPALGMTSRSAWSSQLAAGYWKKGRRRIAFAAAESGNLGLRLLSWMVSTRLGIAVGKATMSSDLNSASRAYGEGAFVLMRLTFSQQPATTTQGERLQTSLDSTVV